MARTNSNDLNKTRYTRRDYESIKSDLIKAIPSLTQEWTSREEADPGIVLIKLMAMFGDTLSYNVDKIALELYIQTVTQRKNCAKILRLLGYKMHWYRSGRVIAHIRLEVNQDAEGNLGRIILTPYQTQLTAGNIRYTVTDQGLGSGQIDIYSDTTSTPIQLIEGTPVTDVFDKSTLVNNRYYFGSYNLDETEIILSIDNVANTRITCELTDNLYLVSSNSIIYYEFNIDEYDRPYIQICDGWEDIAGSDTAEFTVTYILSSGSLGNISSNAFSNNLYNYIAENTNPSNLIITNLSNVFQYDDNGYDLDSYNRPGYDPQSVTDAKIDSAKYVFTHDTLVTSSDYEKGCKRASDQITVSKMVDSQVIINDQLDLNDICTRALDNFSKVYVEEDSISNPDIKELNQYLLAYQVIMYLAYRNFDSQFNYYSNLNESSFWSLKLLEDDPYGGIYWNPTSTYLGDGSTKTFKLIGAKTDSIKNQSVKVRVTVNETEYSSDEFTRDGNMITLLTENLPDSVGEIAINTDTNIEIIPAGNVVYNESTGTLEILESLPETIDNLIIHHEDRIGTDCIYTSTDDSIHFTADAPENNATISVTKEYYIIYDTITLRNNLPNNITSLFINGTPVGNYDYEKPVITLKHGALPDTIDSLIVNGKVLTPETDYIINSGAERSVEPPGYYPYKPTDNILLSVRDLLKTLKVLNVQVDFGTMKVFPFKVEGIVHLTESVDPFEALQIIDIINEALTQAYYPDLHPIGETPDFIEIVDIIQNADPRIRYFDAIDNIVKWAPEVQRRLADFDKIFDTTSAIMYNGLSDAFNLSKRFMRYRFKNTAVTLDSEEEGALQMTGSELGAYNIPNDYGTAYLVNYSAAAGLDYVVSVLRNTYITLQLNNLEELRALSEDIVYRGYEYINYIRHFSEAEWSFPDSQAVEITSTPQALTSINAITNTLTYPLKDIPSDIADSGTLITVVTRDNTDYKAVDFDEAEMNTAGFEGEIELVGDTYILTVDQFYKTEITETTENPYINTGLTGTGNIDKVYANGVEVPFVQVEPEEIQIQGTIQAGTIIKIVYYLKGAIVPDVISVKYEYYGCSFIVTSDQYIDKILYLNKPVPRIVVGTYQELEDYDTSSIVNGDIAEVLSDEEHGSATTYYERVTSSWNYIGLDAYDYITPSESCGKLYSITTMANDDTEDVEYIVEDYFEDPSAGEISSDHNSSILSTFNENTYVTNSRISTTYDFKFNSPGYVYFKLSTYNDVIDSGQTVVEPDIKVTKSVLINNTGMQWIKED